MALIRLNRQIHPADLAMMNMMKIRQNRQLRQVNFFDEF